MFHGKFLYFMGGPKNIRQVIEGVSERGMNLPELSLLVKRYTHGRVGVPALMMRSNLGGPLN